MEDRKRKLSRVERGFAALLVIVIATGLWQGYASWWFGAGNAG